MPRTGKWAIVLLLVAAIAGVAYWATHRRDTSPFALETTTAPDPQWTLVTSDGTDPWVVAVKPPDTLTQKLFSEMSRRAGAPLVASAHPAIPLVLRPEFDDALQGAFGIDTIQRLAQDLNIATVSAFQPVCLAQHTLTGESGRTELYFVPFTSAAFNQLRVSLMPDHPEQSGIGTYDPGLLTPVLLVGATGPVQDDWWPIAFNRERDCFAEVEAAGAGSPGQVPASR